MKRGVTAVFDASISQAAFIFAVFAVVIITGYCRQQALHSVTFGNSMSLTNTSVSVYSAWLMNDVHYWDYCLGLVRCL